MKKLRNIIILSFLAFNALSQSTIILPSSVIIPKATTIAPCTPFSEGKLLFNNNTNQMQYCNGTDWVPLVANGGLALPYSASSDEPANASVFTIENTGGGRAIFGKSQSQSAIRGQSVGIGSGVSGESVYGVGVSGFSTDDYGLKGESNSGIGMLGLGHGNFAGYFKSTLSVEKRLAIGFLVYDDVKAALHVKSSTTGWGQHIRLENFSDEGYAEILHDAGGLKFRNFQNGEDFIFRNAGNTTLATLSSIGELCLLGNVNCTSDIRLKQNIIPLNASLSALSMLKGYHYNWKSSENPKLQTGLIAQEVQAIFPELVNTDKDGMLSVNYIGLIPHLVEAVKELNEKNKEIEDLKIRLAKIEKLLKY